jgi:sulfoxide reductase heme-binding subunit YedZ
LGKRLGYGLALAGVLVMLGLAGMLALRPAAALAAGSAPQAANKHFTYSAQLSGQVTDTYLGTDDQGYSIHYLVVTATLSPQGGSPPLGVRLYVSEAFFPDIGSQQEQDVLPGGGTVSAGGILRGDAAVTSSNGIVTLYVANTSGLYLDDGSMHFDVEGTGTGKASGGKTSLYLTIDPSYGDQITGQVSGSLDIPQAALDLITSNDPLAGPTPWYLMRASGLAALLLLAATVLIGLALRVRLWKETLERWRVYDVHLTVSVLTGVFLAAHLLLVFLDRVVPFSLVDMLVPLHASYQPIWVAAGILALYLLLVVWGSSLLRSKMSYSLWRKLHPLALGALGLAMLHALFAGTDGPTLWLRALLVIIAIAVIWLFNRWMGVRSWEERQRRRKTRAPRQPQGGRQALPQPAPQYARAPGYAPRPNYQPAPRRTPPSGASPWAGEHPAPKGQAHPRRVSQE